MNSRSTRPALPLIDEVFGLLPESSAMRPPAPASAMGTLSPLVQPSTDDGTETDVHLEVSPAPNPPTQPALLTAPDLRGQANDGPSQADSGAPAPLARKVGQPFRYSMPNLVYTPVELGTVRIGHLEERENAAPLPVRDDQFRITRLVRKDGQWLEDPLQKKLLEALPAGPRPGVPAKLREIPIRLSYDAPDLVCRTRFEAFHTKSGRSVCASVGAGQAKRFNDEGGIEQVTCAGPEGCEFAKSEGVRCKLLGRVHFEIEGQSPNVDNNFIFRSTSINTLRNLEARLARFWALFGGRLRGVPFRLVLRSRTTPGSRWSRFYFVDLELRQGVSLIDAKRLADREALAMEASGLDYEAWEHVIRAGLANGALVGDENEAMLVREFFEGVCEDELGTDAEEEGEGQAAGLRPPGEAAALSGGQEASSKASPDARQERPSRRGGVVALPTVDLGGLRSTMRRPATAAGHIAPDTPSQGASVTPEEGRPG